LEPQALLEEQPLFVPQETLSDFTPAAQPLHSFLGAGDAHPAINPANAATMMHALVGLFMAPNLWGFGRESNRRGRYCGPDSSISCSLGPTLLCAKFMDLKSIQ